MSDLLTAFAELPPRENDGARAANRFDYQKNWSICHLMELHASGEDYLMVLEHHEDVAVLNFSNTPNQVDFYQVKTKKTGNWTIHQLIKPNGGNKPSIMTKLYDNYLNFRQSTSHLVFVSQQPLSNKLQNGKSAKDMTLIPFDQLSTADKEKVHLALEGSNAEFCDHIGLAKINYLKTDLRLEDHTSATKGKLVEFFEKQHPDSQIHASLAYKTIFDEVRRKTTYERVCESEIELTNKSIGREQFEEMIGAVLQHRSTNELWGDAQPLLTYEYKALKIRGIRKHWEAYVVDKMDATDEVISLLRKEINEVLDNLQDPDIAIKELVHNDLAAVRTKQEFNHYSDGYIEAAVIYEVVAYEPLSETDSTLTEKTK